MTESDREDFDAGCRTVLRLYDRLLAWRAEARGHRSASDAAQ
jgi:hypothetical protein